jgi:hypothetical protein
MDHNGEYAASASGAGTATVTRNGADRADTATADATDTTARIAATRMTVAGPVRPRRRPARGDGWIVAAVLAALFVLLLAASVDLVVAVAATAVVGIAAQGLRGGRTPRS